MDGVGKVDHGGARGQTDHVAPRGEHEHLVADEIVFDGVEDIGDLAGFALRLQQVLDPADALFDALVRVRVLHAQLILPVGGDAVFGGLVHLVGADLHLKGDALPP